MDIHDAAEIVYGGRFDAEGQSFPFVDTRDLDSVRFKIEPGMASTTEIPEPERKFRAHCTRISDTLGAIALHMEEWKKRDQAHDITRNPLHGWADVSSAAHIENLLIEVAEFCGVKVP